MAVYAEALRSFRARRGSTSMSAGVNIRVLAGKRKLDTYLFIPSETETGNLPAELLLLLGELREVITLDITSEKKFARCTGADVLEGLANAGYYLQMPPGDRSRHDDEY